MSRHPSLERHSYRCFPSFLIPSPECACGLPNPASTSRNVADTSASRRASLTIFLNRLDSSTEIILVSGERRHLTPLPRSLELRPDALLRCRHFTRSQAVFLKCVIG